MSKEGANPERHPEELERKFDQLQVSITENLKRLSQGSEKRAYWHQCAAIIHDPQDIYLVLTRDRQWRVIQDQSTHSDLPMDRAIEEPNLNTILKEYAQLSTDPGLHEIYNQYQESEHDIKNQQIESYIENNKAKLLGGLIKKMEETLRWIS